MNAIKARLKSKTYLTALILSALTIVEAQIGVLTPLFPASLHPYLPLIYPLAMMLLREVTTTALSEK